MFEIRSNLSKGKLTNVDQSPTFTSIPANTDDFLGREFEMHEIMDLIDDHRMIEIVGPPGIGKTSLARNLGNYIFDRKLFADGIIYVGLRGCETSQMFITRLSIQIEKDVVCEEK
jgi:MoxR-like ATPase